MKIFKKKNNTESRQPLLNRSDIKKIKCCHLKLPEIIWKWKLFCAWLYFIGFKSTFFPHKNIFRDYLLKSGREVNCVFQTILLGHVLWPSKGCRERRPGAPVSPSVNCCTSGSVQPGLGRYANGNDKNNSHKDADTNWQHLPELIYP